jgi:glycosyltransferase involved in cell wall biosynthesis
MNHSKTRPNPCLSLGMPVFNGGKYIEQTLLSLLNQSFHDFELIISDNASIDATEEICRDYASQDKRIRYYHNVKNLGAAPNFNRVFQLSFGQYFKWAAHDDLYERDFLLKCVEKLEQDPTVILVYSQAVDIDHEGRFLRKIDYDLHVDSIKPYERFRYLTCVNHSCFPIFGVIRSHILKETLLIGSYVASDRVLLAELALWGKFYEIPEPLFLHREHPLRSTRAIPDLRMRLAWFATDKANRLALPTLRLFKEYIFAIRRPPLSFSDKARCYSQLIRWWRSNWKGGYSDTVFLLRWIAKALSSYSTSVASTRKQ